VLEKQTSNSNNYLNFLHKEIHFNQNIKSVQEKEGSNVMVMNHSVVEQYIPLKFNLEQNYPNPFNGKTKIKYYVPFKTKLVLMVFNSDGFILEKVITKEHNAGVYEFEVCLDKLPGGIYFYQLITDKFTETRCMELIK
jgi:hypothetical protein